ncbi:MAG: VCBS domain-containing protein, partial [Deltaproteobacteria bacterium]|nr:VCBS domain-containing protein [Deltaproteobacteria bacterium]
MKNSSNMIVIIPSDGLVRATRGTVVRINSDGSHEAVVAGEQVHQGDQMIAGQVGGTLIELANGRQLDYFMTPGSPSQPVEALPGETADTVVEKTEQPVGEDKIIPLKKGSDVAPEPRTAEKGEDSETDEHHGFLAATRIDRNDEHVQLGIGYTMTGKMLFDEEDNLYNLPAHGMILAGNAGTLSLNADGHWNYQLYPHSGLPQQGSHGQSVDHFAIPGTGQYISIGVTTAPEKPAIISGISTGSVTEDIIDSSGNLVTDGNLLVSDNDSRQAHFQPESQTGQYGALTIDQQGHWSYQAQNTNPTIQALSSGSQLSETFTIHSADGTPKDIHVTIQGTNDKPVIDSVVATTVDEGNAVFNGQLTATDIDHDDTVSYSTASTQAGFTLNADGHYSVDPTNPAFNHLAVGETANLIIPVIVTDNHGGTSTTNIEVTITGTNDAPALSVNQTTNTTGTLTETDVDTSDTHTFDTTNGAGHYGTLDVNPATGAYTYSQKPSVAGMNFDKATGTYSGTEVFAVEVKDNHGGVDTKYITMAVTA